MTCLKNSRKYSLVLGTALTMSALGLPVAVYGDSESSFEEAHIYFELNNTDGDLGIHGLIDGDPWSKLRIKDPRNRLLLQTVIKSKLRQQGMTEFFFESAEPTFDELDPADFFARFKEGYYHIRGRRNEGGHMVSYAEVTHTMPAPPVTSVNGEVEAQQCDDEESGYDAPEVSGDVTITWDDVTMSHPDAAGGGAGVQPPIPVVVNNYEVVVEVETEDEFESVLSVILPPDQTSFTLPEELVELGDTFKYEVLVREESYNQTATESCFELEDD